MRYALRVVTFCALAGVLPACSGADPTDTDAVGPDCGAYAGIGRVGATWDWERVRPEGDSWTVLETFTRTVTAIDLASGRVEVDVVGADTVDYTGTMTWVCDDRGLSLARYTDTRVLEGRSQELEEAYDPALMKIPYSADGSWDAQIAVTTTTNGAEDTSELASTGQFLDDDPVSVPAGEFAARQFDVYEGPHLTVWVAPAVGAVQVQWVEYGFWDRLVRHTP